MRRAFGRKSCLAVTSLGCAGFALVVAMKHASVLAPGALGDASALDAGYYFSFAVYCFFHMLESTNYLSVFGLDVDAVSKIAVALALLPLVLRLAALKYTPQTFLSTITVLAGGLLVFFLTRSWICLSVALFVTAGRGLDVRMLMKVLLVTSLVIFCMTVGGVLNHSISATISWRQGDATARNSLGFSHPNLLGLVLARICTAVAVLRWGKKPMLTVGILMLSLVVIGLTARSRTAEAYIVLLICAALVNGSAIGRMPRFTEKLLKACFYAVAISALGSWLMMAFFTPDNHVMMAASRLLSHRPYSSWYYFQTYGVQLFGNSGLAVDYANGIWTGDSYATYTIDNAWIAWLLEYGLVPALAIFAGIVLALKRAMRSGRSDGALVVLAIICAFYAIGETSSLAFDFNPLLVLVGALFEVDSAAMGAYGSVGSSRALSGESFGRLAK